MNLDPLSRHRYDVALTDLASSELSTIAIANLAGAAGEEIICSTFFVSSTPGCIEMSLFDVKDRVVLITGGGKGS